MLFYALRDWGNVRRNVHFALDDLTPAKDAAPGVTTGLVPGALAAGWNTKKEWNGMGMRQTEPTTTMDTLMPATGDLSLDNVPPDTDMHRMRDIRIDNHTHEPADPSYRMPCQHHLHPRSCPYP